MPKKKAPIDIFDLNMPEVFADLIRERNLYAVLKAIAEACRARAVLYQAQADAQPQPPECVLPLLQDEIDFFDNAAAEIEVLQGSLEVQWKDRAPHCADGDFRRWETRRFDVARTYFKRLIATVVDQGRPGEERKRAASELVRQGKGTVWFNRETGKPDFDIGKTFHEITQSISDPETSEEERAELAGTLLKFVGQ